MSPAVVLFLFLNGVTPAYFSSYELCNGGLEAVQKVHPEATGICVLTGFASPNTGEVPIIPVQPRKH